MTEIRKKSAIPIYAAAAVWIIYCLFFPLYKASHFIILILISLAVYVVLSKIIPDTVTYIEKEPESTGNPDIDALLETGRNAIGKMRKLSQNPSLSSISGKINRITELTEKIFENLYEDGSNYQQIKRFSDYFLPATLKLLNSYDEMQAQNVSGENISGTIKRIEDILDTTISAYEKQLDALFANKALDIETDISVMENMMRSQGLYGNDFDLDR